MPHPDPLVYHNAQSYFFVRTGMIMLAFRVAHFMAKLDLKGLIWGP